MDLKYKKRNYPLFYITHFINKENIHYYDLNEYGLPIGIYKKVYYGINFSLWFARRITNYHSGIKINYESKI
jgi:hypothetical protein